MNLSALIAGSGTFPTFVSVSLIDLLAALTLVIILIVLGLKFLIRPNLSSTRLLKAGRKSLGIGGLTRVFLSELVNRVLLQRDVINNERLRRFAHLCMFWGFIGLGVTTTLDYFFNEPGNYIPFFGGSLSAIRWLGNISGVVMLLGASIVLGRMVAVPRYREKLSFTDVWFAALLFLVGVTGFATEYFGEIAHSANPSAPPAAAYTISQGASLYIVIPYGIHLVLIALLFLSAPISAFAHALRVPTLRYLDSVGKGMKKGREGSDPHKRIKEEVMIQQVREHYDKKSSEPENREDGEAKKETASQS